MHGSIKQYGLIGRVLGHSFSKSFFTKKFLEGGIEAEYINFEIPSADGLKEIVETHPNLIGLNVTIPYKEDVIPLLDNIDPLAKSIGAVNTIKIERKNGSAVLTGYNTDIIGFTDSIRPYLKATDKKALILGTGGAAKAIYAGLQMLGIKPEYVSRSRRNDALTYDDLTPVGIKSHSIIVNTTPLGMWPNVTSAPSIPYEFIGREHIVFDAIYNPDPTLFLQKCADKGATTISGIKMLYGQAIASWNIWNDQKR